jgi:hypothetical protein
MALHRIHCLPFERPGAGLPTGAGRCGWLSRSSDHAVPCSAAAITQAFFANSAGSVGLPFLGQGWDCSGAVLRIILI